MHKDGSSKEMAVQQVATCPKCETMVMRDKAMKQIPASPPQDRPGTGESSLSFTFVPIPHMMYGICPARIHTINLWRISRFITAMTPGQTPNKRSELCDSCHAS